MSGKVFVFAAMSTACMQASAQGLNCTRTIPVNAHYYSKEVVRTAHDCEVKSPQAIDSAHMRLFKMCASMRGHYRAVTQKPVCRDEMMPVKVGESSLDFIDVAGECVVEGDGHCKETGLPTFMGTITE